MNFREKTTDILVLGGGAAGFFAAIRAAETAPGARILLLEKSRNFLSKVKVSGGGRCNVTCGEEDPKKLAAFYPRGGRMLSRLYYDFGPVQVKEWFTRRGVRLKTEADGRVFPVTDSSQTVIDCLTHEAQKRNLEVEPGFDAVSLEKTDTGFTVVSRTGETVHAQRVIVATGGSPKEDGLAWLKKLGHEIVSPLPSLFTFNSPGNALCTLMGVSVREAQVRIAGSKLEQTGPLLITHWGLSGPAVLKLSAFAARDLARMNYTFTALIRWTDKPASEFSEYLERLLGASAKRLAENVVPEGIPSSLWKFLLAEAGISEGAVAGQVGKKQFNRLLEMCCNYAVPVKGKTTFKEEFVTTGGVALTAVDPKTMESKTVPGLYFAGEVLDIDGVTGGYNFQAAWTTGYMAGTHAAASLAG